MTIRIMLVGLVASLGFELPSGSDVSRWAQAGTEWVHGRMADLSGPGVEVKLDLARPSDCQQADETIAVPSLACEKEANADRAFQAVSEDMARDLSADLLAIHGDQAPGESVGPTLVLEGPAPVGLPEGEELVGCLVVLADEAATVEVASIDKPMPDDSVISTDVTPVPTDRVSAAVRLTREAVQAWADLMLQPDEECHPTR
jgi:hypothetical protein